MSGQLVLLHPEILGNELQITQGLDTLLPKIFYASLIQNLQNSDFEVAPINTILDLSDTQQNPKISEQFFINAWYPEQKVQANPQFRFQLLIHEWYLGYGISKQSFYDFTTKQNEINPLKAGNFGSVISYSIWDSKNSQVVQYGVSEASIIRPKTWETKDFQRLALKNAEIIKAQIFRRGVQ